MSDLLARHVVGQLRLVRGAADPLEEAAGHEVVANVAEAVEKTRFGGKHLTAASAVLAAAEATRRHWKQQCSRRWRNLRVFYHLERVGEKSNDDSVLTQSDQGEMTVT